jgi:hypothetical protein
LVRRRRSRGNRFDKVFAVRVNFFWQGGQRELPLIQAVLKPKGQLTIVYEPPRKGMIPGTVRKVRANLEAGGFLITEVLTEIRQSELLCIQAVRTRR